MHTLFFIRYRHPKTLEIIIESNPKAILDSLIDENENGIEKIVMFLKKIESHPCP